MATVHAVPRHSNWRSKILTPVLVKTLVKPRLRSCHPNRRPCARNCASSEEKMDRAALKTRHVRRANQVPIAPMARLIAGRVRMYLRLRRPLLSRLRRHKPRPLPPRHRHRRPLLSRLRLRRHKPRPLPPRHRHRRRPLLSRLRLRRHKPRPLPPRHRRRRRPLLSRLRRRQRLSQRHHSHPRYHRPLTCCLLLNPRLRLRSLRPGSNGH